MSNKSSFAIKSVGFLVCLGLAFYAGLQSASKKPIAPTGQMDAPDRVYATYKGSKVTAADVHSRIQSAIEQIEIKRIEIKKQAVLAYLQEKFPQKAQPENSEIREDQVEWLIPTK